MSHEMLDATIPEIDDSFILISKNYLNNIEIDIRGDFVEPLDPRMLDGFPFADQRLKTLKQAEDYFAGIRKKINNKASLFEKICTVLQAGRYRAGTTAQTRFMENIDLFKPIIDQAVKNNQPIQFVLPSFPFKCPNLTKVRRRSPDMAEILCLSRLYEICTVISFFYPPGAKFVIIADGQVYKDMFGLATYKALKYRDTSQAFIQQLGFDDRLEMVDMLDLIHKNESCYQFFRNKLSPLFTSWWNYHKESDRINSLVDACTANIVSCTHVSQDLIRLGTSKIFSNLDDSVIVKTVNQVREKVKKRAEKCAFEYAFFLYILKEMNLVQSEYPNAIRCTVHPKPKQWGIHLVNAKSRIFPWHGVAYHGQNGWKMCYEYDLIREECSPVHLLNDDFPFFYEDAEHPFI